MYWIPTLCPTLRSTFTVKEEFKRGWLFLRYLGDQGIRTQWCDKGTREKEISRTTPVSDLTVAGECCHKLRWKMMEEQVSGGTYSLISDELTLRHF